MEDINWGPVFGIAAICMLLGGLLVYGFFPRTVDGEGKLDTETIAEAVAQAVATKEAEIDRLTNIITGLESQNETESEENVTEEQGEVLITGGYLMDELSLNDPFEDTLSDRELDLFDGKVNFDGKKYDTEETLILKDIKLLANENDFEGEVYMVIPKESVEYKLTFEDDLDTSLISDEETLEFSFLGQEVKISDWTNEVITFFMGTEMIVDEGEIIEFEDYEIVLISVTDEAVYLSVTDSEGELTTKIINSGKTRTVNGLQIKVENVFSSATRSFAELVIGVDIKTEIENDDEYSEDSAWKYVIKSIANGNSINSIGIILDEEFTKIDEDGDEEFPAVGPNETFCLPNNYLCMQFNGMSEEDTEKYEFEINGDFVRIKGNFEYGTKDYDEIYVYTDGLIYEDDDLDSDIIGEAVELGDTDLVISASETGILIEDSVSEEELVLIDLGLIQIQVDKDDVTWTDITTENEDYLTNYGILVSNPEDSTEDQEVEITVPENKLEGSISVY